MVHLDYICKTIIDKISNHKLIEEKMISDLSVCIAYLIINSESVELPKSFEEAFEALKNYWFYSAYKDTDKEVSFSYVRAYQAMMEYQGFVNYKEYVEKIMKASKEFKGEYELIKIIKDNLGEIMPQDLCKQLNITPDELKIRIKGLIEQGYIYIRPIGKFRFYSLSNSGIELFKLLSSSENLN